MAAVSPVLDLVALRSLVAIADCGGFRRAAEALSVSQSAVSQHVRRLEKVVGRPLVEPAGRGARLTPEGELLLSAGRRILAVHDDALDLLGVGAPVPQAALAVGSTEHAADHLIPRVMETLAEGFPGAEVRFRIDRGARLVQALERGTLDVAVLVGTASGPAGQVAGELPLAWYSAPGWDVPPPERPLPLVAVDEPCTIRTQALTSLARAGRAASVVGEAGYLAGVLHAARAGVGVALLADVGPPPQGLERRADLPAVAPEPMQVRLRRGASPRLARLVAAAVAGTLAASRVPA
ncbi:LysR family transcriptional regulator [Parafrankia elaeagni]|uniref:LysR family transcriptional regulator n=1 Tax=Parafrankia elaeagni TaxID=222534 RepID=UPI00037B33E6|nr:LysR family transcriptional regulator [Parafrankia elaeagni]